MITRSDRTNGGDDKREAKGEFEDAHTARRAETSEDSERFTKIETHNEKSRSKEVSGREAGLSRIVIRELVKVDQSG